MKTSEIIESLATALSKAQGEIEPAPKDATNPHFKSKYATLAACKSAAQAALAKHGLSFVQEIKTDYANCLLGVVSILMHTSGQWIETETWCRPKSLGPQDVGSAATYLRRYGFSALIGIVSEDDDDANAAQPEQRQQYQQRPQQQQQRPQQQQQRPQQQQQRPQQQPWRQGEGKLPLPPHAQKDSPELDKAAAETLAEPSFSSIKNDTLIMLNKLNDSEIERIFAGNNRQEVIAKIDSMAKAKQCIKMIKDAK